MLTGQVKKAALGFLGIRPKSGRTKELRASVLQHSMERETVCQLTLRAQSTSSCLSARSVLIGQAN